jgi:hypothetical protein
MKHYRKLQGLRAALCHQASTAQFLLWQRVVSMWFILMMSRDTAAET